MERERANICGQHDGYGPSGHHGHSDVPAFWRLFGDVGARGAQDQIDAFLAAEATGGIEVLGGFRSVASARWLPLGGFRSVASAFRRKRQMSAT